MNLFTHSKGHTANKAFLLRLLSGQRLPGALLFCGPEAVGKFTLAKEFGRIINCPEQQGYCGTCEICRLALDTHIIDQGDKIIQIGQIREIQQHVLTGPFTAGFYICIINEAHKMNEEAMNAFLKLLEEPPNHVLIILVTHKPNGLLPTILSRTLRVAFGELSSRDTREVLRNTAGFDQPTAERYLSLCPHSMACLPIFKSKQLSLLYQDGQFPFFQRFWENPRDIPFLTKLMDISQGQSLSPFLRLFLLFFSHRMHQGENSREAALCVQILVDYISVYDTINVNAMVFLQSLLLRLKEVKYANTG